MDEDLELKLMGMVVMLSWRNGTYDSDMEAACIKEYRRFGIDFMEWKAVCFDNNGDLKEEFQETVN